MWAENREYMLSVVRKRRKNPGRPFGSVDGYKTEEVAALRAKAEQEADRIIRIMEEENLIEVPTDELVGNDKEMAKEALKATIVIMRTPGDQRNRLAAARTILEYTKQKPAAKTDLAVTAAEDFLGALLAKEQAKSG